MVYDCLIVGAGPAGLSAALQCRTRGLSALVIDSPGQSPLDKAERIDNYLGLPGLSGRELLEAFRRHAAENDVAQVITGRVLSAYSYDRTFALTVGGDVYEGKTVILAAGAVRAKPIPGEETLLGKGLSYCASCDGMLYRGREVVVIGLARDAAEEAELLAKIGCRVTFLSPERPAGLPEAIPWVKAGKTELLGTEKVTGVLADGVSIPCEGVFLLRDTVAPEALFPGLAMENGYIQVDRTMATSVPGVYACGDCTGAPLQIAKAAGEGQVAAHNAGLWIKKQEKA